MAFHKLQSHLACWHIQKYVYWLDTHSVNVLHYVQPYANAAHFFRHIGNTMCFEHPKQSISKEINKKSASLEQTRIIYHGFF